MSKALADIFWWLAGLCYALAALIAMFAWDDPATTFAVVVRIGGVCVLVALAAGAYGWLARRVKSKDRS